MANLMSDGRTTSRPMNVEQIVAKAENFEYNPLIPFKYWLRTCGTILKEAEIYEQEGNDQQTYLLLYRHCHLVTKHLVLNPAGRQPENRGGLSQAFNEVKRNIQKLEVLKPRLNKRYERYEQLMRERDARRAATAAAPQNSRATTPVRHKRGLSDTTAAEEAAPLAASENKDLAVQLARKEIKRRALARKPTRQAGITEEVEHERRTGGMWGNWEEAFTERNDSLDRDTLSKQIQAVRSQVNGSERNDMPRSNSMHLIEGLKSKYSYPVVPHQTQGEDGRETLPREHKSHLAETVQRPPEPPPKDPETFLLEDTPTPPERPEKAPLDIAQEDALDQTVEKTQQEGLQSSDVTFKPSASLENGSPLRTIFLPPNLRHEFLKLAFPNTRANRETCGILCGTLISNALFISKLVIPEQESTSDTCEMVNESALFDYVDGEDLIVLGWIHTHPTQTCFMSSRDLHTHGGYQVMLPESIAIVCAPSKSSPDDWGVFRLTDPPGMKIVLNCTQTGLFHPHPEGSTYTGALRPGHVFEARGLDFDVVDLRPRKP